MKSFATLAVLAGALTLAACNKAPDATEANAAAATAMESNEAMAASNAVDANAADANAAASGLEGTGNPIGPG